MEGGRGAATAGGCSGGLPVRSQEGDATVGEQSAKEWITAATRSTWGCRSPVFCGLVLAVLLPVSAHG